MSPPARRFLSACFALCLLALAAAPAHGEVVNRLVMVVNDQIATLLDYEQRLGARLAALQRSELDPDERRQRFERLPAEVYREMLEELLVMSRAEQLGIRIGESELNAMIEQVRASNDFENLDELRAAVAQSGQTWEQFRDELIKTSRFRELISREVSGRLDLAEDTLRRFYRDNPELFRVPAERRLREIVVLDTSGLPLGGMETLARDLRERLLAGEEPETVIEATTEPPRTSGVIDLGWVPAGDLDPALEQAVESLAVGEWSAPVAGRGGLHLIELLESREARMRPFDEVKNEIYAREQDRLFRREYPRYLRELQESSYVVLQPPPEAAGFERFQEEAPATSDPLELFRRKPAAATTADAPAGPAPAPSPPEPPRR